MRTWSIILGVVIFLCVVSVSFSHTVDLYQRVGFTLWESIVFTIAVETTFFLSGWTIIWRRNKGEKTSGSAYAGFIYGVILVLFSNSAYTVGLDELFENNIAQWVLALSVVLGVLIAESIISQNLAELHREDGDRSLQNDGGWSLQNKEKVEKKKVEAVTKEQELVENVMEVSTPPSIPAVEKKTEMEKNTPPSAPSISSNNLSSSSANSISSTTSTLSTPAMEEKKLERVEKKEGHHQEVEENRLPAVEKEGVEKIALEIYEQEGRLPGRKRLMEEAGVTEWEARKTLQELRKKVG